jgi:hypothetical protein
MIEFAIKIERIKKWDNNNKNRKFQKKECRNKLRQRTNKI